MYLGFAATGTVLAGQAVNEILHLDNPAVGIVVFGVLTAVVAVTGYKLIHTVGRIATVVGIIGFSYLAVRLFTDLRRGVSSSVRNRLEFATFLLAVSLGAGWQLTFGPIRRRLFALPAAQHQRPHDLLVDAGRQRHRLVIGR